MLRKLCCTTPELEYDAKGRHTEIGQAGADEDPSTAGTGLKHSQTWHGSHPYCLEQTLNTVPLALPAFSLEGNYFKRKHRS